MAVQKLAHGDCREAEVGSFDAMICDPPYSAYVHKNATSQSPKGGTRHRDLGFQPLSDELREDIARFSATIKRWSIIYCDVEGLSAWKSAAEHSGAQYIRAIPWIRWSMPSLAGDRPPQGFEVLGLFWGTLRGRKSWHGPGNLTHLAHSALRGSDKHKTEKPLDQALDLVSWFSNPEEHIFDPCAGSGTVGLACRILGRNYTGYEIDAEWAEKAKDRLIAPLSERDEERYQRWLESQAVAEKDAERRAKVTARARKKMEEARG